MLMIFSPPQIEGKATFNCTTKYLCKSSTKEKPVFRLGELVEFRFHGDGPPVRIVQGIQLINDSWFYSVEWMSPSISEKGDEIFTSRDSIARVTDYDLERVRL